MNPPSSMSQQLRGYRPLTRRLAAEWRQIVVLERLARGAGATRWFFVTSMATLEHVFDLLRGGSSVSLYFSTRHLNVAPDNEDSRLEMFDEVTEYGELVLGYPSPDAPELEMEVISGPSELAEFLMLHPDGSLAVWGQWPPREDDGEDTITVDLVDADGVLRTHPH